MSKVVNHSERRREILRKALPLFAEMGYPQVTYQQLAEVAGLSRTVLYRYFKTKREIFDEALHQMMIDIARADQERLRRQSVLTASEKLEQMLLGAVQTCIRSPELMRAIFEYLMAVRRQGEDAEAKIRRHTTFFRRLVRGILRAGMATGEFVMEDVSRAEDIIFAQMEAVAVRVMFYNHPNAEELTRHCSLFLKVIRGELH